MKRASRGEWWSSGPAVLYLDDVEEIHGLFSSVSSRVTLRLDGFELGSPVDAGQLKSTQTDDAMIETHDPYATFEARAGEFGVYVSDRDNLTLVGLRDAVEAILKKRRLWTAKPMGSILLALFPGWLLWFVPQGPPLVAAVAVALAGLVFYAVVGTISWRNRFRRSGKVILRDSRATISFWQEHHDLMLVLISSAGTFAATLAAGIILYMLGFVPNR